MSADPGSESVPDRAASEDPPGVVARRLMRRLDRAALATARCDGAGWPYPSLVLVALDHDASPLLLVSALAEHTRNLQADDRVGLLFDGTAGLAEPLAGARVTVLGRASPTGQPRHRARYLARHPGAAVYQGFGDFACYRVEVERAHLVGGFGRVHRIDREALILDAATVGGLAEEEAALVRQMAPERVRALAMIALGTAGPAEAEGWAVTGIDPEGCDLRRGAAVARIDFDRPVSPTVGAVGVALQRLAVGGDFR